MERQRAILLALILAIALGGCAQPARHNCPAEELILDAGAFPSGTSLGSLVSPLPDEPGNSAGRTFYLKEGIANHDVVSYANSYWAAREFDHTKRATIFTASRAPGDAAISVDYVSPLADQYRVACGRQHSLHVCQMIGQYDNYFVRFSMHMTPGVVGVAELTAMLRDIDTRMAGCLQKPLAVRAGL